MSDELLEAARKVVHYFDNDWRGLTQSVYDLKMIVKRIDMERAGRESNG